MKLLFASDSFKGTISSEDAATMLTHAAMDVFGRDIECVSLPIADGGEGTAEAFITATNGERITLPVHGPRWQMVGAYYGVVPLPDAAGSTQPQGVVIEMAQASGLPLLSEEERNPLLTTTYGTGELIIDALERGYRQFYIALGGSATNDGGIGCMRALGVRFLDAEGHELQGCGEDLIRIERIDLSKMDERLKEAHFTVMCDVNNPLCGPYGATYTFAEQKGADHEMRKELEKGMRHYRDLLIDTFHIDPDTIAGAGAAGGLGAALLVFLNAQLQSGIETLLTLTRFDDMLRDVDLVVTGEGCTDWQSAEGKVLSGIGLHCQRMGVPAVALVGSIGRGANHIYQYGICSLMTTVNKPMLLCEALTDALTLYQSAARRMFRLIKVGMELRINT